MAPLPPPERELRFVAVSGQKSRPNTDQNERRSVRAFVMRDYLRQKSDPSWTFTPAKVADRMTSHVSRFRSSRPPSADKPKKRKTVASRERWSDDRFKNPRPLVPAPQADDDQSPTYSSPHDLDSLDPFGTFGVDLGDNDTQSLLQYYQTAFWANSYACNPEARWISVALMDPAIIHATLSLVAIHRRDCFSVDLSKVYFKHRGEAMKIVARRLSNLDESLTDETIGAVALLSSSDNHFDWPSEAQSTHSRALSRLIALRGGMKQLNSNRHIQRVAGWADLLQSAMHGTNLQVEMPEPVEEVSADELEPQITNEEARQWPLGIVLQDLASSIRDTLRQLRILSSLKVSLLEQRNDELCQTFSNLLWKFEYLSLDRLKQSSQSTPQEQLESATKHELLANVAGIAGLIQSYLTLRDLAAPILYRRLSGQLRGHFSTMMASLEDIGADYLEEDELAIVLWSLFLGWRSSRKDLESQAWFSNQLAQVCWRHGILTHETVQAKIQAVVPQSQTLLDIPENFWTQVEEVIWSEMLSFEDHTMISV
jgi:hypothetical protein